MDNRILSRVARAAASEAMGAMESVLKIAVPSQVVHPRSDSTSSCSSDDNSAQCEKPITSSSFTMAIILGVAIPVISAVILFFILHRRHIKKQRLEDANDRHGSMDFGLGDVPQPGRQKKDLAGGSKEMDMDEKPYRRQISMDMGVDSLYLLPPELHGSRESIHSLSRSMHHEDPYRNVAYHNDGTSIRSLSRLGREEGSMYTGSSNAPSKMQEFGMTDFLSNNSPTSRSASPIITSLPPRQASLPTSTPTSPVDVLSNEPSPSVLLQQPLAVHLPDSTLEPVETKTLPSSPSPNHGLAAPAPAADRDSYASNDGNLRQSNNYLGAIINSREPMPNPSPSSSPSPPRARKSPPLPLTDLPVMPFRTDSMPMVSPPRDDELHLGDFKITPPSPGKEKDAEVIRGRQRYSTAAPPANTAKNTDSLLPAARDTHRFSMGLRPLPPNAVTESDDPEVRANRIRSFYKEYFDETKAGPPQASQGGYYEDFDENYLGEAAYYDPDHNNFVMPYAQPVTRRAMTPPPRGPRFQGPRGNHGSIGAMSMGGRRGPPMMPHGHNGRERAFSSASGRPGPKRPLPPPAALNSLPTPSKLRDDSFALMGAIDFAPPQSYRERAAGRSESPLGERRPYSPAGPSFTPTASAFDELAPMPSPHMLRNSRTFTALDFAPSKSFKDADSMSDAGSIRSNRSNISAMQLGAIRNGAYRVSRIPQEVVFTRDDLATTLKPQWGMRVGS